MKTLLKSHIDLRVFKLWIYIIGGGVLAYFLFSGDSSKKSGEKSLLKIKTQKEIQEDIEEGKKIREILQEEKKRKGYNSISYRQARAIFLKGFRDFKNGLYTKSMDSFHGCLSLFPDHGLCKRYLLISERKHSERIQYNMLLGKQYKDQGQYARCYKVYQNVMNFVKDFKESYL